MKPDLIERSDVRTDWMDSKSFQKSGPFLISVNYLKVVHLSEYALSENYSSANKHCGFRQKLGCVLEKKTRLEDAAVVWF